MIVREEQPTDVDAIRFVVEAAFPQPIEARLIERLRADGDGVFSLVAVEDVQVVGHLLLSRMKAPFRALGLGPIAVAPDRQGRGIGGRLIHDGIARASSEGWQAIFVLGDPAYYRRFGFDPDRARGFHSPYAGPHFMVLPLGGALPATERRVAYAQAFTSLE